MSPIRKAFPNVVLVINAAFSAASLIYLYSSSTLAEQDLICLVYLERFRTTWCVRKCKAEALERGFERWLP